MRKVVLALLITAIGLNLAGGVAWADGMILPEPLDAEYLTVRYHHVTVDIRDHHAITRVEQEFYNPQPFAVAGRYMFPVPPDAILSEFQAAVDGQPQALTRQSPAATNAMLFDVIAQRRDPSLLEYVDWETLAFDISIPAFGSRRMVLEYEQVLAPTGGLYHYRYILSTERYSPQPLEDVSITVSLTSSSGLSSLYSSSHAVTTERIGPGRARITWSAQNVQPAENFDLFFAPSEGGFGSGLLTGRRADRDHFLFLFAPEINVARDEVLPKDIVFVIDRSGSMSGEKIEQARNALQFILGQLNPRDRFSIVGFDDQMLAFSHTLQPVEPQTLADARRFVDSLYANNSTDLDAALQLGLSILAGSAPRSDATRVVVFLTDGLPTAGITDEVLIASRAARSNEPIAARLHVFGVGYDVNTHLLDRLANENGGTVTYVPPGENLEAMLSDFYTRIANPVLTDVSVDFDGLEASDVYPQQIPDLFQGSSLMIAGRYRAAASNVTVRVRGYAGDESREYTYQFDLEQMGDNDFVPRLWATRRIGELLDRVRVEGESAALVEEIRALGLNYGLVTPYTTFVIQAQDSGAASAANMGLYSNQAELNQASGQTTIQARVQNQAYQLAAQANLAQGANVLNSGQHSLAQLTNQVIDLALLKGQSDPNLSITDEWIAQNIAVDRQIDFGSPEYFKLAADPAIRAFLQTGRNVLFAYAGETIAVQDAGDTLPALDQQPDDAAEGWTFVTDLLTWIRGLLETIIP